jgi:hypothetical protein
MPWMTWHPDTISLMIKRKALFARIYDKTIIRLKGGAG